MRLTVGVTDLDASIASLIRCCSVSRLLLRLPGGREEGAGGWKSSGQGSGAARPSPTASQPAGSLGMQPAAARQQQPCRPAAGGQPRHSAEGSQHKAHRRMMASWMRAAVRGKCSAPPEACIHGCSKTWAASKQLPLRTLLQQGFSTEQERLYSISSKHGSALHC